METKNLIERLNNLLSEIKNSTVRDDIPESYSNDDIDIIGLDSIESHSSTTIDEIINSEMFYPFPYLDSDKSRIIDKLTFLLVHIPDINHSDYKFVKLCIKEVKDGSGLTIKCIDYLNKIHGRHSNS